MVEIRLLKSEDVQKNKDELVKLMNMVLSENIEQHFPLDLPNKYVEDMLKFTKDGTAILIGAFDEENLIGFHWGYITKVFDEVRMHSYHNAIEPDYRGQKIGTRFFKFLEEEAVKRNIYLIEAMCTYSNKGAVNYHLNNGFEIERLKVKKKLK